MGLRERISRKKDLVVRETEDKRVSVSPTPEMLIQQAIDQKVPIETMEKLMAMRRELKEEEARGAYYRDLAAFQAECPVIGKNKDVTEKDNKVRYSYASLDEIAVQVNPYLAKHGFSYTFKNKQTDTAYTAICIPMHRGGHSEPTEFIVPVDLKAYMSAPQKVGSARSFANRYAFCNAFGIQTSGEDNDAQDVDDVPEKKKDSAPPPTKSKEYLKLEKQILRNVGLKCFKGPIEFRGNPVDLDVIRNQAQEYLPKKVHSMERIKDTAIKVAEMLEIALKPVATQPPKDEVVIEKPEIVEEKKESPPVKSTEYLEIEARIIKDILHPEFIGKVLFTDDDGKTHEPDLGKYKKKIPDVLAKNFFTMEELEKKADMVARLLLAATTKHEKFETPNPKPVGMVENPEKRPTNQEQMNGEVQPNMEPEEKEGFVSMNDGKGQGVFGEFYNPADKDTEGNLTEG